MRVGTCPPGCHHWSLSRSAPLTPHIWNIRACLLSMYYPPPRRGDNALLLLPIMRRDVIEVSQSQRRLIFNLEQKWLLSTFKFQSDQVNFAHTALSAKGLDKVLYTSRGKGTSRQAFTLKHRSLNTSKVTGLTGWHWGTQWRGEVLNQSEKSNPT